MGRDYYEVLGVPRNAGVEEIKRAYRKKAVDCHPDTGGSHAAMVELNEAWAVLSDADLRRLYDETFAAALASLLARAPEPEVEEAGVDPGVQAVRRDMVKWLWLVIARDFACAEFHPGLQKWVGTSMAGDSVSGFAFFFAGGTVGVLAAVKLLWLEPAWFAAHQYIGWVLVGGGWTVGGEMAIKLHKRVAESIFSLDQGG